MPEEELENQDSSITIFQWNCMKLLDYHVTVFLWLSDEVYSFQNNPKNLHPSYMMDLDLWDCLGRVKHIL